MSTIEVNKITPVSGGTTVQVGESGDTINIPSGATLANAGSVTGLPASSISSGTIAAARLGSGTASSSTVLYGDGTFKAEPGGGKMGQLLQVVATINTTTSSDVELMSLAITPSATSSKIYMLFTGSAQMGGNEYASWDFYRGSLSSGTKILDGGESLFNGSGDVRVGFDLSFLDSPNTTSATTYTVVGSPVVGSIQYGGNGRNTFTLMEVLA